ncbi:vWA domain-containing protein [Azospirillum rugosum]|uniref:Serine/threonine-protein kinase PpkA n=1 Tax=Azospirillum rugosum TaxID=416170 RepID=A0ABS4SRS8_9PROT|nr:vWA domain-containing protein [Azospirillum rugosum]MBP2295258.1 serine/threonine-protein kinase PpkA [Azospirillum rugosum]MDQ0528632.1 serine/threonine-protein kinase PpkA [Azospirillum rugosum]
MGTPADAARTLARFAAHLILGGALIASSGPALAQKRTPELIPGKKTLYQRVLTRTGAMLRSNPSLQAPPSRGQLAPMSPFYVFGRTLADGREWLELGSSQIKPEGWVEAEETISWNQTLTVAIPSSTEQRQRVLFFRRDDELVRQLSAPNAAREMRDLLDLADRGLLPDNSPVLAWEPPEPPGATTQFYVQPILGVRDVTIGLRDSVRILHIASETAVAGQTVLRPDGPSQRDAYKPADLKNLEAYRAGVVFVIDTTVSMQPYIDRVHETMRLVYRQLSASRYGQNIGFGVVAFRSDINKTPALGYNAQIMAPLRTAGEAQIFLRELDKVQATTVSSDSFDEDSFAGLKMAIKDINWTGYHGRFVVLITDAGSKEGKASAADAHASDIRGLANTSINNPIAILALHLLTDAGARANNHTHAHAQYVEVTKTDKDGVNGYFPVFGGTIEAFRDLPETIAGEIIRQIEKANSRQVAEAEPVQTAQPSGGTVTALRSRLAALGRTMQLRYLGQASGRQAPRMLDAWMADRDIGQKRPNALEIKVLISKRQLSQIALALEEVIRKGEETRGRSRDFFNQLRMVSALVSHGQQDPDGSKIERLIEFGGLNELLDGLPYRSQLMEMTEQHWISMPPGEQRMLLDALETRIKLYRDYNNDPKRWTDLEGSDDRNNDVMQIPLDQLP